MLVDRCIFRCRSRVSLSLPIDNLSFSQSIWPRAFRMCAYNTSDIPCILTFADHAHISSCLHTRYIGPSVVCVCKSWRLDIRYIPISVVCAHKRWSFHIQCSCFSAAGGHIVHFHRSPYKVFLVAGGHRCQFHHIPYNLPSVACEYINCFHHSLYTHICSCCAHKNCWVSSACTWISVDHVHILEEYVYFWRPRRRQHAYWSRLGVTCTVRPSAHADRNSAGSSACNLIYAFRGYISNEYISFWRPRRQQRLRVTLPWVSAQDSDRLFNLVVPIKFYL